MTITQIEKTIVPQTPEGRKFADEYIQRLKSQGVLKYVSEDTQAILIEAEYRFVISDEEVEG